MADNCKCTENYICEQCLATHDRHDCKSALSENEWFDIKLQVGTRTGHSLPAYVIKAIVEEYSKVMKEKISANTKEIS